MVSSILGWVFMGAALCGLCLSIAASWMPVTFSKPPVRSGFELEPVTLLKPLCQAEQGLAANLETFLTQDYPTSVQMVLGVLSANDTAIPVAEALGRNYPDRDITLVVSARGDDANPKIANLKGMLPHAKHDVLVLSDSDMSVPRNYLPEIANALAQPGVGCVTCLYTGKPTGTVWSVLCAMGITYQFLPNVLLGATLGLAAPCFGSTIAMRKSILTEIGGFGRFGNCLADDYEIGRAVRARGYRVAFAPLIVAHTCTEETAGALFRHELRWARTIRSIDPLGYAGSLVTHTLPLSLIGVSLQGFSTSGLAGVAAVLAGRFLVKLRMDRIAGSRELPYWLLPARDMVSFAIFITSFFMKDVEWRSHRYRVGPQGALTRG